MRVRTKTPPCEVVQNRAKELDNDHQDSTAGDSQLLLSATDIIAWTKRGKIGVQPTLSMQTTGRDPRAESKQRYRCWTARWIFPPLHLRAVSHKSYKTHIYIYIYSCLRRVYLCICADFNALHDFTRKSSLTWAVTANRLKNMICALIDDR